MKDLVLVADSHLRCEDDVAEGFFRFLRREGPTAGTLVLGGDIFDLWVARPALELPVHRAFIRVIRELEQQGVRVLYVQGNRDYFVTDQYGAGPFAEVVSESLVIEHGGRRIHVSHGDLVNLEDRQYLAWRRFSRSLLVRTLFGALPSRIASRFSLYLERKFRTTNQAFRLHFPEEQARRYAQRVFEEPIDTIVLGHFHQQRVMQFEGGAKRLFVLPGWREDRAYLRIDERGAARFVKEAN